MVARESVLPNLSKSKHTFNTEAGRAEAIADIRAEAQEFGADAVIGASFDYEEMAEGMPWVNLSGTAVKTRRE